jgi:hypothetical protein
MAENLDPLVLDLVAWLAKEPRSYFEVMEAWRTSCPRLTVWEEAVDRGYVTRKLEQGCGAMITITALGRQFLARNGRASGQYLHF